MSRFLSDKAKTIVPYVAGEQPKDQKFIKLNSNENAYPPTPGVIAALSAITGLDAKLYPDAECSRLREVLAAYYGLEKNQIFVGNGSDEVLAMLFLAFFNTTETIAFPDLTYSFYSVYANLYNIPYKEIPLTEDFNIDFSHYPTDLKSILVANPNAPTGIVIGKESIETLLRERPDTLIVVDEAYIDFGGESVISLIDTYENLLVVQTMSKSRSLAGMRVGFAFGSTGLIEGLKRIKNSFNSYTIDVAAQRTAQAVYEDVAWFEKTRTAIMKTRDRTAAAMRELGMRVLPSCTNFVLCTLPGTPGLTLQLYLRENGVLVRHFGKPRIKDWLRISIGTDEEMDVVMALLQKFVLEYSG